MLQSSRCHMWNALKEIPSCCVSDKNCFVFRQTESLFMFVLFHSAIWFKAASVSWSIGKWLATFSTLHLGKVYYCVVVIFHLIFYSFFFLFVYSVGNYNLCFIIQSCIVWWPLNQFNLIIWLWWLFLKFSDILLTEKQQIMKINFSCSPNIFFVWRTNYLINNTYYILHIFL